MARLIVFLRGINLGPSTAVDMGRLREILTEAGYGAVRTHLRSGNILLDSRKRSAAVASDVAKRVEAEFGFAVPSVARTRDELSDVVRRCPMEVVEGAKFQVMFLSATPADADVAAVDPAPFEPERFWVSGREIYQWHPNGMQKTKLGTTFWEKRLGGIATGRNWNTTLKMLALADSP